MSSTDPIKAHCFIGAIGIGRRDITPALGIYSRCWGAATNDCATGVHRQQTLTVFYFKNEQNPDPMLLINMEIPWMGAEEWELYLGIAAERSALIGKSERIILNLTHNHSSAPLEKIDPSLLGAQLIDVYRQHVADALQAAIMQAIADCRPAQLTVDMGHCSLAKNRDLKIDVDGPVFCGFNPEKEADDTLLVGRITDTENSTMMATFVNYACHPTSLAWENTKLSPDYAGAMRELVESLTGAPCCLLQGASGELSARHGHQGDTEVADKQGRQLGYAVMSCLEGMIEANSQMDFAGTIASGADLAFWSPVRLEVEDSMLEMRAEIISFSLSIKDDWPSIAEFSALYDASDDRVLKERYRRRREYRKIIGDGATCDERLWRWQLGGFTFFASGFELYSDFQTQVREQFPEHCIAVCNLCNGSRSYLVPAELYTETLYQKDVSPYAAGSLELIITHAKNSFTESSL